MTRNAVPRNDKLAGARQVISGTSQLALVADRSLAQRDRWIVAGFGMTSIVVGVSRARGIRAMEVTGTALGAALGVGAPLAALSARRRPETGTTGSAESTSDDLRSRRHEQLRGVNDLVGGAFSIAMATDPAMPRMRRLGSATIGASAIVGGYGRFRGQRGAMLLGGAGYLAALGLAGTTAIARTRARRAGARRKQSRVRPRWAA